MTVREAFATKYPQAVEEVVKVQRETLKWINEHRREAIALGAKEHGITFKDAQQLADWSNDYDVLSAEDIQGLREDQEFLIENKLMQKNVDVEKLVLPIAKH